MLKQDSLDFFAILYTLVQLILELLGILLSLFLPPILHRDAGVKDAHTPSRLLMLVLEIKLRSSGLFSRHSDLLSHDAFLLSHNAFLLSQDSYLLSHDAGCSLIFNLAGL